MPTNFSSTTSAGSSQFANVDSLEKIQLCAATNSLNEGPVKEALSSRLGQLRTTSLIAISSGTSWLREMLIQTMPQQADNVAESYREMPEKRGREPNKVSEPSCAPLELVIIGTKSRHIQTMYMYVGRSNDDHQR